MLPSLALRCGTRLAWLGILAVLVGCGSAPVVTPSAESPSSRLARLVAEYAGRSGDTDARVPDVSDAAVRQRADSALVWLGRVDAIPDAGLSHEERLTRDLLSWEARRTVEDTGLHWYRFSVLPELSPFRAVPGLLAGQALATPADRKAYLALLSSVGPALAAVREMLAAQAARGIVLSRERVDDVIAYYRGAAVRAGADALAPARARLQRVSADDRRSFEREVAQVVETVVVPTLRATADYVDTEVRRAAASGVGLWQYPGGEAAYRAMVKRETTLDVTPETVHALGLAAMDTLEARMKAVRDSLGFQGTKAEFHEQLRRDPRFYVSVPDSVGGRLMDYARRIEPVLDQVFARRPKAPYGARRLDPALEPSMTYGYYNWPIGDDPKGYYNFNGSALDQRSLLVIGAISFHELVPGHHFQILLQRENQALPDFRRDAYYAGYGEGWGEYASSVVAAELGMYRDPYEVYGRLVFDAFFIARLVVDTGMNLYGWPRSKAMDYMKEHTLESDVQINSETLRYSTRTPAQALAYRMGRETIVRLRAKAMSGLGDRFDLRRFHEAILMSGSLPLAILEQHVDWWIANERAAR